MVLFYISLYRLFKAANPENAVGFLILCIFVNVATPFIVFALRNKDEGLPRQPDAISAGQGLSLIHILVPFFGTAFCSIRLD